MKRVSETQADLLTEKMFDWGDDLEVDQYETSAIMDDGKRHCVRKVDGAWFHDVKAP